MKMIVVKMFKNNHRTTLLKPERRSMSWIIDYVRSCFCKHEWECLQEEVKVFSSSSDKMPSHYEWVYRCKKCCRKKIVRT